MSGKGRPSKYDDDSADEEDANEYADSRGIFSHHHKKNKGKKKKQQEFESTKLKNSHLHRQSQYSDDESSVSSEEELVRKTLEKVKAKASVSGVDTLNALSHEEETLNTANAWAHLSTADVKRVLNAHGFPSATIVVRVPCESEPMKLLQQVLSGTTDSCLEATLDNKFATLIDSNKSFSELVEKGETTSRIAPAAAIVTLKNTTHDIAYSVKVNGVGNSQLVVLPQSTLEDRHVGFIHPRMLENATSGTFAVQDDLKRLEEIGKSISTDEYGFKTFTYKEHQIVYQLYEDKFRKGPSLRNDIIFKISEKRFNQIIGELKSYLENDSKNMLIHPKKIGIKVCNVTPHDDTVGKGVESFCGDMDHPGAGLWAVVELFYRPLTATFRPQNIIVDGEHIASIPMPIAPSQAHAGTESSDDDE